jgi:hypothetical protein
MKLIERVIRWAIGKWLPGWKLARPGTHVHANPRPKVKKLPPPDVTAMEATLEI